MATSHQTPTPRRRLASDPAPDGANTPPQHDATTTDAAAPDRTSTAAPDTDTPRSAPRQRAVRDVDDPDIDAALDALVDAAPPLPYQVRARLAWLLQGHHHDAHRDRAA